MSLEGLGKNLKIGIEIGGRLSPSLAQSLRAAEMQVAGFGRGVSKTLGQSALAGRTAFKDMLGGAMWQQAAAGAAGVGLAMAASFRAAANFEGILSEIGKTANIGQGELKGLSKELLALSGRDVTNLAPAKLAEGIQDLVAQGLSLEDSVASMGALGKVATATNSDLLDITKTGFQLQNALKIKPTELQSTFDGLAFAGKQGAFELRDMAQLMPTVAAAAGSLGIQGKEGAMSIAAMLQMVRKDAPTAEQAATRMTDAMLKMTSPDAVKRFSKFGVNIEQVLSNAKARGINPMEAALDELQRVTGGDIFKLSEIFGDKEAKLGLMSLMKYRQEYEKLKADAGGSQAAGTVDVDYQRSLATFQGTLQSFQNSTQRLGIAVGTALLPPLTKIAAMVTPMLENVATWATENQTLATGLTITAGALAALILALPVIAGVVSGIGAIGTGIGLLTAAFPALAGIGTVLAVAGGPITLIIAGIIGIGAALTIAYRRVEWFRNGVNGAWAGIQWLFGAMASNAKRTWGVLQSILGAAGAALMMVVEHAKGILGGLWKILRGQWDLIAGIFTLDGNRIAAGLKGILSGWGQILSTMQASATKTWRHIAGGFRIDLGAVGTALNGLWTLLKGGWDLVVGIFTLDPEKVTTAFSAIWQGAGKLFTGITTIGAAAWKTTASGWALLGTWIITKAGELVSSIGAWFGNLPGRLAGVWEAIRGAAGKAWQWIKTEGVRLMESLLTAWASLPLRVVSVGLAIGRGLLDGARQGMGQLWNILTGGGGGAPSPANNIRPLPQRQFGGPVSPGMSYLVGERRPEVLTMGSQSGRIIPSVERWARDLTLGMPALPEQLTLSRTPQSLNLASSSVMMQPEVMPTPDTPGLEFAPLPRQAPSLPPFTMEPGAIVVNVSGGNADEVRRAVQDALSQFQINLEASYRSLLSD